MRATLSLLCAAGLVLTGCGRTLRSVTSMAENTRTATEQMASSEAASNVRREIQIYPDASTLRETPALKLSQRYETREGPDGFMVYDTQNHTIARLGSRSQAGLTLEQAKTASEALTWANNHGEIVEDTAQSPVGAPP